MQRYRSARYPAKDINKWAKTIIRLYESQGPAVFEKYQYSIAEIIRGKVNRQLREKLLEYVRDIARPKDVLLDALIITVTNDSMNTYTRIRAVDALRALLPKRMPSSRHTERYVMTTMENVRQSPQITAFSRVLEKAMKSMETRLQVTT